MKFSNESKLISFRLYKTFCVFIFLILNLISISSFYDSTEWYIRKRNIYTKIQGKEIELKNECEDCKKWSRHKFTCEQVSNECYFSCCAEGLYDINTGDFSDGSTSKYSSKTFKELDLPEFDYVPLFFAFVTFFIMPFIFFGLRRWFVWVFNID